MNPEIVEMAARAAEPGEWRYIDILEHSNDALQRDRGARVRKIALQKQVAALAAILPAVREAHDRLVAVMEAQYGSVMVAVLEQFGRVPIADDTARAELTAAREGWEALTAAAQKLDPRDPDPTREGIFRDHNCYKCQNGKKPCINGNPNQCDYPHARND